MGTSRVWPGGRRVCLERFKMSAASKLRRQKRKAKRKGLLWSSSATTRAEAKRAGLRAILTTEAVQNINFSDLEDFDVEDIGVEEVASFLSSKKEIDLAYREAWNAVIRASRVPESEPAAEAPATRKQIDIGTVGSKLPKQTIGMMKPTADPEAWKAWVVPAIGLAAAFILWRRS